MLHDQSVQWVNQWQVWKYSFCYSIQLNNTVFGLYYFFKTNTNTTQSTFFPPYLLTKSLFLRIMAAAGLLCQRSNVWEVFPPSPTCRKIEKIDTLSTPNTTIPLHATGTERANSAFLIRKKNYWIYGVKRGIELKQMLAIWVSMIDALPQHFSIPAILSGSALQTSHPLLTNLHKYFEALTH